MAAPATDKEVESLEKLGLTLTKEDHGLKINVAPPNGTAAENASLDVEDLIVSVNGQPVRTLSELVQKFEAVTKRKCTVKSVNVGTGAYTSHELTFPSNPAPQLPAPLPSWIARLFSHNPALKGLWVDGINEVDFAKFTFGSLKNNDVILSMTDKHGTSQPLIFAGTLGNFFNPSDVTETKLTVKRGNNQPHECLLYKSVADVCPELGFEYRREPDVAGNHWKIMRHTGGGDAQTWGMEPGDIIKSIQSFNTNYGPEPPQTVNDAAQWGTVLAASDFEIQHSASGDLKTILHLSDLGVTIRKGPSESKVVDDAAGAFYGDGLKTGAVIQSVRTRPAGAAGNPSAANTNSLADWNAVLSSSFYEITYVTPSSVTTTIQYSKALGLTVLKNLAPAPVTVTVKDIGPSDITIPPGSTLQCKFPSPPTPPAPHDSLASGDEISVGGSPKDLWYLEDKVNADAFVKLTVKRGSNNYNNVEMPPAPPANNSLLETLGIKYWAMGNDWKLAANPTGGKPASMLGLKKGDVIQKVKTSGPEYLVNNASVPSSVWGDTFELTYSRTSGSGSGVHTVQYWPAFGIATRADDEVRVDPAKAANRVGLTNGAKITVPSADLFTLENKVNADDLVELTLADGSKATLFKNSEDDCHELRIKYRKVKNQWMLSANPTSGKPADLMGLKKGGVIQKVKTSSHEYLVHNASVPSAVWGDTFELTYSRGGVHTVQYWPAFGIAKQVAGEIRVDDSDSDKKDKRVGLTNGAEITAPSADLFDVETELALNDSVELTLADGGKATLFNHPRRDCDLLGITYRLVNGHWNVSDVEPNGAADLMGLTSGDIISSVKSGGGTHGLEGVSPTSSIWKDTFELTYSKGNGSGVQEVQYSPFFEIAIQRDSGKAKVVGVKNDGLAGKSGLTTNQPITAAIDPARKTVDLFQIVKDAEDEGIVELTVDGTTKELSIGDCKVVVKNYSNSPVKVAPTDQTFKKFAVSAISGDGVLQPHVDCEVPQKTKIVVSSMGGNEKPVETKVRGKSQVITFPKQP